MNISEDRFLQLLYVNARYKLIFIPFHICGLNNEWTGIFLLL